MAPTFALEPATARSQMAGPSTQQPPLAVNASYAGDLIGPAEIAQRTPTGAILSGKLCQKTLIWSCTAAIEAAKTERNQVVLIPFGVFPDGQNAVPRKLHNFSTKRLDRDDCGETAVEHYGKCIGRMLLGLGYNPLRENRGPCDIDLEERSATLDNRERIRLGCPITKPRHQAGRKRCKRGINLAHRTSG